MHRQVHLFRILFSCAVLLFTLESNAAPDLDLVYRLTKAVQIEDPNWTQEASSAVLKNRLVSTTNATYATLGKTGRRINIKKVAGKLLVNDKDVNELFVLRCASNGEGANFETNKTTLQATFVKGLMLGTNGMFPEGLTIVGATIDGDLKLNDATVPYFVEFQHCTFSGIVNFSGCAFKRTLSLYKSEFHSSIDLTGAEIGGSLILHGCTFLGKSDFVAISVKADCYAELVTFSSVEGNAFFNGAHFGGSARFKLARFLGGVDFATVSVGGQLNFFSAILSNDLPHISYRFSQMQIGNDAIFEKVKCNRPIDFSSTQVHGNFKVKDARFECPITLMHPRTNKVDCTGLLVAGSCNFSLAALSNRLDLTDARIHVLDIGTNQWPVGGTKVVLDGMSFDRIRREREPVNFVRLKPFLAVASFYSPFYTALETSFKNGDDVVSADLAFHERHRHEREELFERHQWFDWFLECILLIGVGNGREPGRAFGWSLLVVLIGYFVFREKCPGTMTKMEQQDAAHAPRIYNAFWYSLDLFAPAIDLQAANFWKPKQTSRIARHWMRFHRILGWIIVPIGAAALAGILK
jgi:hypothetical protein